MSRAAENQERFDPLSSVQKILGYTQVKTTQRYSHLAQETLLDAVNVAVDALGSAFSPSALVGPCAGLAPLLTA